MKTSCYGTKKINSLILLTVLSVLLSACSTTPNSSQNESDPKDPFEPINRTFWTLTWDYADKYVLKPVALGYVEYVPSVVRTGAYNMALNLNEPSTVINNLLQAKFVDAAKSTGRFVVNSTVGILGLFDPAKSLGLERKEEEFGEVLGSYGVGDGPYLVVPVLGPSSVREEVGDYVDRYYWPLAVLDFWPNLLRSSILGLEARAALTQQEALLDDVEDPYVFVKNAYFQNMEFKVHDGQPPLEIDQDEEDDIDAYLDELDELDELEELDEQ